MVVFASRFPENIKVELAVQSDPDTFVEVGNVTKGIDYIDWNYDDDPVIIPLNIIGNSDIFGHLYRRYVVKIRITFTLNNDDTEYRVYRISACTPNVDYVRRSGTSFKGDVWFLDRTKGVILVSPNGKWHRLCVNDDGTVYGDPLW